MALNIDTSFLDTMPPNVAAQFFDRVAASPDREAFRFPRGDAWESVTWQQAGDLVEAYAAGLIAIYILSDSESRVVFAEDDEQVKKLTDHKAELPHVVKVVTFEGRADGDWVISLD